MYIKFMRIFIKSEFRISNFKSYTFNLVEI